MVTYGDTKMSLKVATRDGGLDLSYFEMSSPRSIALRSFRLTRGCGLGGPRVPPGPRAADVDADPAVISRQLHGERHNQRAALDTHTHAHTHAHTCTHTHTHTHTHTERSLDPSRTLQISDAHTLPGSGRSSRRTGCRRTRVRPSLSTSGPRRAPLPWEPGFWPLNRLE